MKIKYLMAGAVIAGLVILTQVSGTSSYLTSFARTDNKVSVGNNHTGIEEEFPTPSPVPVEENPEIRKKVWVTNYAGNGNAGVDCYIRVSLSYSDDDIGRAVVLKNLDSVNWVFNSQDGYYYYKNIVKQGQSTTPLFTSVQIQSDRLGEVDAEVMKNFRISVYEESIQAGNFSDYRLAWNYYLNPIRTT